MNQSEIDVRAATAADAPELARLRFVFRSRHHAAVESENDFVARCEPWMRDRLERKTGWRAWVAVQRDTASLVGTVWLQLVEKLPNPGDEAELHAYITSVYVQPELRNAGLGSRFIQAALAACRDLEVDTVFLWPSDRSRPLYSRHGFTTPGDILSQRLHP
ncbi:MAG TPA: GNAT family N-acetyltransferase [Gemmatimonadaceae bacterium]|nr:GNAT family N-acetyltransferase [Gemmatimonadaceae bacterium]